MSSSETLSVVCPHIPPRLYPSVFSGSPFILPQGRQKVFGCIWPLAGCRRREDRSWLSSNIIRTDTVATLTVYLCLICVTLNMWRWRKTWVTVEPHNHELCFRQVRPSLRSSCGRFINLHQKKKNPQQLQCYISCMLCCICSQILRLSLSVFLLFKEHVWVTSKGGSGTFDALLVEHPAQLTRDPFSPLDRWSIQMNWLCEMEHQVRSTWCGPQLNCAMQTTKYIHTEKIH